jgi:hypothetical protein
VKQINSSPLDVHQRRAGMPVDAHDDREAEALLRIEQKAVVTQKRC